MGPEATKNMAAEDNSPYPSPGRAWGLVLLLTIAYAVSFVDRQIINLMVEPIKADLQLSDTQISLLLGLAFGLFYTIMGVPLGRAADKYNRRNLIVNAIARNTTRFRRPAFLSFDLHQSVGYHRGGFFV